MRLPGAFWHYTYRAQNAWWDGMAILTGYCNHCPNDGTPGTGGGYTFWRCALRRGHEGLHRGRNYVWTDDGVAEYLPVPIGQPMPDQPHFRKPTMTRRQHRNRMAWQREREATR